MQARARKNLWYVPVQKTRYCAMGNQRSQASWKQVEGSTTIRVAPVRGQATPKERVPDRVKPKVIR